MSGTVCVDASFALKLVLDEPDSEQVQACWAGWLAEGATIIAPCHLVFEVTSVIRNHALAEHAGCELWTADGRLVKAVGGTLPWLKTVHDLYQADEKARAATSCPDLPSVTRPAPAWPAYRPAPAIA